MCEEVTTGDTAPSDKADSEPWHCWGLLTVGPAVPEGIAVAMISVSVNLFTSLAFAHGTDSMPRWREYLIIAMTLVSCLAFLLFGYVARVTAVAFAERRHRSERRKYLKNRRGVEGALAAGLATVISFLILAIILFYVR